MHVVNKSIDWPATANPVRHRARRQPATQGQPAEQPEGARRSKCDNPAGSRHRSQRALCRPGLF
ncbi:hypothetical protein EYF80_067279 [Liparis tanakae]|uniref:Uncharacterized protein n=1 Tax=Liparis tanakae TaxID=230148 RepID=A0A4Z2E1J3_9TELE|nr:hypothetical protein EYF80_067279 [Liparis tanakae]